MRAATNLLRHSRCLGSITVGLFRKPTVSVAAARKGQGHKQRKKEKERNAAGLHKRQDRGEPLALWEIGMEMEMAFMSREDWTPGMSCWDPWAGEELEEEWEDEDEDSVYVEEDLPAPPQPPPVLPNASPRTDTDVYIYWDLDNKHPDWVPPVTMLENLKAVLSFYGIVKSVCAYGNPSTFAWVPPAVREERKLAKEFVKAEAAAVGNKKGKKEEKPYRCDMCGNRFMTMDKLQKHFKQIHEREFAKVKAHKPRAKAFFADTKRVDKYFDAKRSAGLQNQGGLKMGALLTRAGVKVTYVNKKSQAADSALFEDARATLAAHQRAGSAEPDVPPSTRHKVVCLVSDDGDFVQLLKECRGAGWSTVAVCQERESFPSAHVTLNWEMVQWGPDVPGGYALS